MRQLLKSRKGQGTTEYIVIIALVVGITIAVVWNTLQTKLQGEVTKVGNKISSVG
jgi:Flp pilus assembly pilin Flp